MAEELVSLAGQGLDELAKEAGHDSERVFLEPLEQVLKDAKTPADRLLESFEEHGGDKMAMVNAWEF